MDRLRLWAARNLRAMARRVEPTIEVDWPREAALYADTVTVTEFPLTWPVWTGDENQ